MDQLELIKSKILTKDNLPVKLAYWKFFDRKIVFTNGCFDILHAGHIDYLAKASNLGDELIIGLNSDQSVRRLKGNDRPVMDEFSRSLIMAALRFVSAVVIFDEDTPYELIKTVQPHVLVKAADYNPEEIVGYDIVKANGGEVITIELLQGYSTTGVINKIKG